MHGQEHNIYNTDIYLYINITKTNNIPDKYYSICLSLLLKL